MVLCFMVATVEGIVLNNRFNCVITLLLWIHMNVGHLNMPHGLKPMNMYCTPSKTSQGSNIRCWKEEKTRRLEWYGNVFRPTGISKELLKCPILEDRRQGTHTKDGCTTSKTVSVRCRHPPLNSEHEQTAKGGDWIASAPQRPSRSRHLWWWCWRWRCMTTAMSMNNGTLNGQCNCTCNESWAICEKINLVFPCFFT